MSLKDFEILSKLGDGAYSSVYRVRRCEDGQVYALKRVKMGSLSVKEKENALNEIRILASVHHPNVIGYKQAFIDEASKSLWYLWAHSDSIVMEFASNGDLAAKIARHLQQGTQVPEEAIWNIFIHLVRGLKQLHELHIFHRDIKVTAP
jgi:NIMA (never in mitosis gene a)-related kinase